MLSLQSFLRGGRVVGPSWEKLKPKGPKGAHRREPSALEGWILEIPSCDPKGSRALLQIFSTEGRDVGLRWEHSNPKDLKDKFMGGRP